MMKGLLLIMTWTACCLTAAAEDSTVVVRIKGMRCEECAHKVTTVVKRLPGIKAMDFNLERRTVAVTYDKAMTCSDSIRGRLDLTKRYRTTDYNPQEVIRRGLGLQMADMHCGRCADRIVKRLQTMEGVDSIAPHTDKHYVFVRYDANRTCKAAIREALGELGFTPVSYYTSKNIGFAYFLIPKDKATDEAMEEVLAMDGVDDVNVNARRGSMAVTFVNTETTADKLLLAIRAAGIEATLPEPHECKEERNRK